MKKLMLVAALFAFGTSITFAQNAPAKEAKAAMPKKSKKGKKAVAATMYECPMKCEAATAKAGKCGKCGMDLVAKKPK